MHENFTRAEAAGISLKSQTSTADTFQATHCLCYIFFAVYVTFPRLFVTQVITGGPLLCGNDFELF